MNKFDIQQYLVEPDFALWLKDMGFDGECDYSFDSSRPKQYWKPMKWMGCATHSSNAQNLNNGLFGLDTCSIPTFAQTFDFVEEKWGIRIKPTEGYMGEILYSYFIVHNGLNVTPNQYRSFHETKREANIAACNAVKEYISKQV